MNRQDYQKLVGDLIHAAFMHGYNNARGRDDFLDECNRLHVEVLAAYADQCRTCGLALSHGMKMVEET